MINIFYFTSKEKLFSIKFNETLTENFTFVLKDFEKIIDNFLDF